MAEIIQEKMSIYEKLQILTDAAKYDVACTSSGVERKGDGTGIGNCSKAGICHSFSADGRCISLLKILFTNECIYDCKYCINRASNDVERTSFTPEEVCRLTMEFYEKILAAVRGSERKPGKIRGKIQNRAREVLPSAHQEFDTETADFLQRMMLKDLCYIPQEALILVGEAEVENTTRRIRSNGVT